MVVKISLEGLLEAEHFGDYGFMLVVQHVTEK